MLNKSTTRTFALLLPHLARGHWNACFQLFSSAITYPPFVISASLLSNLFERSKDKLPWKPLTHSFITKCKFSHQFYLFIYFSVFWTTQMMNTSFNASGIRGFFFQWFLNSTNEQQINLFQWNKAVLQRKPHTCPPTICNRKKSFLSQFF